MERKTEISIILPTCNSARYLRPCLDSVLAQSLVSMEILCIDALSDDGTLEILHEYARKDSRIKIILAPRRSYGLQVNMGLSEASGRYCAIVDSDDEVSPGMYERLYEVAEQTEADFVKADYYGFNYCGDGSEKKRRIRIVPSDVPHGQVINIFEHQECFRPDIVGIWSGIYRRSFLKEHGIHLNETPGASFQDTGFWLQSYMHAKRAVFLEEPFYRYRLDNPSSSFCTSGKEYCICDEFAFALDILQQGDLMECFSNRIAWVFYRKYKRNLERFPADKRIDFLSRFAEDFRKWDSTYRIQDEYFLFDEYVELQSIMSDPIAYSEKVRQKKSAFISQLSRDTGHPLIIYGCGRVGEELSEIPGVCERVTMFAVSDSNGLSSFHSKPVYALRDLVHLREEAVLVIAVKLPEHRLPMRKMAEKLGFVDIREIPQGVFDIA